MAVSERTRKLRKLKNVFFWTDLATYVITTIVSVFIAIAKIGNKDSVSHEVFSQQFMASVVSLSLTAIIGIVLVIFIKDKARTTLFMIDLIILSLFFGKVGMYTVLGIWFVEEYIIHNLYVSSRAN